MFPPADYARNYGVVFTAYGTGALAGTLCTGALRDFFGHYLMVFPLLAIAAAIGMTLAIALLRPASSPKI
jgi:MFS family permease